MNKIDKHIKDKMNGLEVNPPAHLSQNIKASKPKPRLKHIISRKSVLIPAGLIVAALSIGLFFSDDKNPETSNHSNNNLQTKKENQISTINPDEQNSKESSDTVKTKNSQSTNKAENKISDNIYIKTYQAIYELPSDTEGKWINEESSINKADDGELVISLTKNNPVELIKQDESGEKTKYIIERISKPCIFENGDTSVYKLSCILAGNFNKGKWIAENADISQVSKNKFIIEANEYGESLIVRKEIDKNGVYYDSIRVKFLEAKNDIKLLQSPKCHGDNAIIKVATSLGTDYKIELTEGKCFKREPNKYVISNHNSGTVVCSVIDKSNKSVLKEIEINFPEKVKPDFELTPKSCIEKASIKIKPDDAIVSYNLDGTQIPENEKINLSVGKHILTYNDNNNCTYKKEINLSKDKIINADFDFELSMDKLSARMLNKTEFDDKVDELDFSYNWYHNDKLISTEKEPEIQLNSIVNNIKLVVTNNRNCNDTASIDKLRPDNELIRVPDFFSPNNDGYFDIFKPVVDERLTNFKAVITNRAGQLIYKWEDPDKGWNGKIQGNQDASAGVYFYTIRAYDKNGKPIEKRGTVQLLRNK